nr:MAG TPA: Toxin Ldr, type I toxin-antitoxin system [Caudoviricetes sp.]
MTRIPAIDAAAPMIASLLTGFLAGAIRSFAAANRSRSWIIWWYAS